MPFEFLLHLIVYLSYLMQMIFTGNLHERPSDKVEDRAEVHWMRKRVERKTCHWCVKKNAEIITYKH